MFFHCDCMIHLELFFIFFLAILDPESSRWFTEYLLFGRIFTIITIKKSDNLEQLVIFVKCEEAIIC